MSSPQLRFAEHHTLYTVAQLVQLRSQMLQQRLLPRGPERNERRQIAASLRNLFRDKKWLDQHTAEGSR
jgi:hypothetical protein